MNNTDRKKLINWIRNTYVSNPPYTYKAAVDDTAAAVIADMLINNGVVVRKKSEWVPVLNERGQQYNEEIYENVWRCPVCGEDNFRRNFCPDCGSDMREVKINE